MKVTIIAGLVLLISLGSLTSFASLTPICNQLFDRNNIKLLFTTPLHDAVNKGGTRGKRVKNKKRKGLEKSYNNVDDIGMVTKPQAQKKAKADEAQSEQLEALVAATLQAQKIDRSVKQEVSSKRSVTPLHTAAFNGNKEAVLILIKEGAQLEALDKNGRTPLHRAAYGGCTEIVRLLIEQCANVEAVDINRMTPLHLAALADKADVVDLLVEKGASLKVVDIN